MAKPDPDLERLLRAAAAGDEPPLEMPFGFETRVVALARAQGRSDRQVDTGELTHLLRRVAASALVLTIFAGSAAYWQLHEGPVEPFTNAYAIADTALAEGFLP